MTVMEVQSKLGIPFKTLLMCYFPSELKARFVKRIVLIFTVLQ